MHLGFTRNARLYLLGSFALSVSHSVFQLLRNLYLKEARFDEAFIGHSLSAISLGSLAGALPTALLLVRRRTKPLLVASSLGAAAAFVVVASVLSPLGVIASSVAAGLMLSVYQVTAAPFLAAHAAPEDRTTLLSTNFALRTAAGVIGSLGGGYLFRLFTATGLDAVHGYRLAMIVGSSCAVLSIAPFAMIREEPPRPTRSPFAWHLLRRRAPLYAKIVAPTVPLGLGAGLTIPFLNLYFRNVFAQDGTHIGWYFAGVQIAMTLGVLAGPALARRFGLVRTIVTSELASVPFMLVLAWQGRLDLAVAAFLCRGALMNMAQPLASSLVMDVVPEDERTLVNAIVQTVNLGCWMLSAAVGGELLNAHGFVPPIVATAGLYVGSAALFFFVFRGVDAGRRLAETTSPGELRAAAAPEP